MSDNDLDFLDDYDASTPEDPAANTAPLYKRALPGFFAGSAAFLEGGLKGGTDKNGKAWQKLELFFSVPEEDIDADKNDVIQLGYNLPAAKKPAAIALVQMGVSIGDIKAGLNKPTEKSIGAIIDALEGNSVYIVQVPNAVKGKGGKRYPKQIVYTEAAWKGLNEMYPDGLTPEAFGVTVPDAAADDDDLY